MFFFYLLTWIGRTIPPASFPLIVQIPLLVFPSISYFPTASSNHDGFYLIPRVVPVIPGSHLWFFLLRLSVLHLIPPNIYQLPKSHLMTKHQWFCFPGGNRKNNIHQSQETPVQAPVPLCIRWLSLWHYLISLKLCPCWWHGSIFKMDHNTCFSGHICACFLAHGLIHSRF